MSANIRRARHRGRTAAPEDVADLLALLAVIPSDQLIHPTVMWLNHDFGQASDLVGRADAE